MSEQRWPFAGVSANDGGSVWVRDTATDTFNIIEFNGMAVPRRRDVDPGWLAQSVGARLSASDSTKLYPGAFRFEPGSGKPLGDVVRPARGGWLPPYGEPVAVDERPLGTRSAHRPIQLAGVRDASSHDEDTRLPAPPVADPQFLAARMGTASTQLVALDPDQGGLMLFRPKQGEWTRLKPRFSNSSVMLPMSRLDNAAWALTCWDEHNGPWYLPTDEGLAKLSVLPLANEYQCQLAGGRCVGAPVRWGDHLLVPMVQGDQLNLVELDAAGQTVASQTVPGGALLGMAAVRPLIDSRRAIWMSASGQLVARRGGAGYTASFQPWGPGFKPEFALGAAYAPQDGNLWQQGFDSLTECYSFFKLGAEQIEKQSTSGPRFVSGRVAYKLASRLTGAPWLDPESGMDSSDRVIVVPLLESEDARTVLAADIHWVEGVSAMLDSREKFQVDFVLRDDRTQLLRTYVLTRPWLARAFIYDGKLVLVHPDWTDAMPAWHLREA